MGTEKRTWKKQSESLRIGPSKTPASEIAERSSTESPIATPGCRIRVQFVVTKRNSRKRRKTRRRRTSNKNESEIQEEGFGAEVQIGEKRRKRRKRISKNKKEKKISWGFLHAIRGEWRVEPSLGLLSGEMSEGSGLAI
uniref:Uncharacterized protein n=1 Tax=Noccaea caerulescens TaxID=107243 RepID=A0A1J3IGG2_NOCCA